MTTTNFKKSSSFSISEFEKIILDVIQTKSTEFYQEKIHTYIHHNYDLEKYIHQNITINKKLFNLIQKTDIQKISLITEPWCLDACIILPLLRAIELINSNIKILIFPRDTNSGIMNQFLTNGSQSIPIVFVEENSEVKFRWGPRSQKAKDIITPILNEEYSIKQKALTDFYRQDLTKDIQEEWVDLF